MTITSTRTKSDRCNCSMIEASPRGLVISTRSVRTRTRFRDDELSDIRVPVLRIDRRKTKIGRITGPVLEPGTSRKSFVLKIGG
eukprot:scaffold232873_cov19-Prasinocladus_malaysianus.AAC.2